jgi:AraC-like DNA-binding protein
VELAPSRRTIPPALAGYVTRIVVLAEVQQRLGYQRLPDGQAELVVRFGDGRTTSTMIGTRSHALSKPASEPASFLLVRFAAASVYPFANGPASRLTDALVPLEELWPPELTEALARACGAAEVERNVLDALAAQLRSAAAREPSSAQRVRAAVRALAVAPTLPTVSQLASGLGASERHLRRAFDEVVGMSPKRFLRTLRFQRALALARAATRPDWAGIAQRVGYYDQAHLIADFASLAGASPTQLARRTRP